MTMWDDGQVPSSRIKVKRTTLTVRHLKPRSYWDGRCVEEFAFSKVGYVLEIDD